MSPRIAMFAFLSITVLGILNIVILPMPASAATYYVDGQLPDASDDHPGTAEAPWKTISRAAAAEELRPGRYRRHPRPACIAKCGGEGLRRAPGSRSRSPRRLGHGWCSKARSSSVERGPVSASKSEPRRALSQCVCRRVEDRTRGRVLYGSPVRRRLPRQVTAMGIAGLHRRNRPLQRIGLDPIYPNEPYLKLATVGRGLADLIQDSFYFDSSTQTLYLKMAGEPGWHVIEVGVRGFVLSGEGLNDVVFRGLEIRHNRQPGGQWSMVSFGSCERLVLERCRIYQADFCGLGVGRSKDCTIRECDLSYNGNTGLGMGECEDCLVERLHPAGQQLPAIPPGWHCGGMKCIPANRRCTIRDCEVAYNIDSDGIWFDSDNTATSESSATSATTTAGRASSSKSTRAAGSSPTTWSTPIAGGESISPVPRRPGSFTIRSPSTTAGIVCMPRGDDWPLEDVHVLGNLFLANRLAADGFARAPT